MNSEFETFLDQQYLNDDKKDILRILNDYGWYSLLDKRMQEIFNNAQPDYETIVSTMIQSVNDKLRDLIDQEEKKRLENVLAMLFRDLIAYLSRIKFGFYNQLPSIKKSIQSTYSLNGDNFSELEVLINFEGFVYNIENAVSISNPNKTRHLKWSHLTVDLKTFIKCLKYHFLITEDSNFEELFKENDHCNIIVPKKSLKRFTLLMAKLFTDKVIIPIGGKSTFSYLESKVTILETNKPISKGYMRKTSNNTKKLYVGFEKHEKFINDLLSCIEGNSGL